MKQYIGIDLGGTNCRVAIVREDGVILKEQSTETQAAQGPQHVMERMIALIHQVKEGYETRGIGIGFPGPIAANGEIIMSTNLPGFAHFPVVQMLEKEFHLPVCIDNDANVAGLAEARVGAGKGCYSVYYVTLSTGIGGGLVVDGKTLSGRHGHAGEVGNIVIDRSRAKLNHLNAGAVENEASGTAVVRKASELFGDGILHAGMLFDLAKDDARAMAIVDEVAYDLAMMFSSIGHVIDPDMFVIGGGMMKSKDVFLDKVVAYYKTLVHAGMQTIEFKQAELKEPGIIGAAMLPISKGY